MSISIWRLEMSDWQKDLHYNAHGRFRYVFACLHTNTYTDADHHAKTLTRHD
ncbi:unnamed protein product [Hymenolepis diminuta]|uniref:Uncharacterized protein n=1 Tax=Hymenolepis diminuta TaxID=6216 RepID=A0A564YNG7_HYMDI|nr:unnamed protein product [Hymenolepis diminuta]